MKFHSMKRSLALAGAICLAVTSSVLANPAAPTGLQVPQLSTTEDGATLIWERPSKTKDIYSYHVYMDGKLIANTVEDFSSEAKKEIQDYYAKDPKGARVTNHVYRVTGLQPGSQHTFVVKSLDKKGEESEASNAVKVTTLGQKQGIVDITKFGAVGDGKTINTYAIQKAIQACPVGGTVVVPAGTYKTGAFWLKSDMTLEIQKGATILGSENPEAYPYHYKLYPYLSDERYYSLINCKAGKDGKRLQNIRIVGEGTIDGNGWKKGADGNYLYREKGKNKDGTLKKNHVLNIGILAANQVKYLEDHMHLDENKAYPRRSSLLLLQDADHVYVEGVTLRNPANHGLIFQKCNDAVVENIKVRTFNCNNGDGIEFGHGSGLKVFNNVFDTGDDCVNFAAGQGSEGEKGHPTENIWIFNNSFHHGHGAVVMGSHTAAYIQKLLAEDNVIDGTEIALRMKTNSANGGGARDIHFRNNAARNILKNFFIATTAYSDNNAAATFPVAKKKTGFYNILVEDCTVNGTKKPAIESVGLKDATHHDIPVKNVTLTNGQPGKITNAQNINFLNVNQKTTKSDKDKKAKKDTKSKAAKTTQAK